MAVFPEAQANHLGCPLGGAASVMPSSYWLGGLHGLGGRSRPCCPPEQPQPVPARCERQPVERVWREPHRGLERCFRRGQSRFSQGAFGFRLTRPRRRLGGSDRHALGSARLGVEAANFVGCGARCLGICRSNRLDILSTAGCCMAGQPLGFGIRLAGMHAFAVVEEHDGSYEAERDPQGERLDALSLSPSCLSDVGTQRRCNHDGGCRDY
jgi:hypothetical protein